MGASADADGLTQLGAFRFMMNQAAQKKKKIAGFGGGSGAEERHTEHALPDGYGSQVEHPQAFMPLIHLINTKTDYVGKASGLLECPCTPQRKFDMRNGTIDGRLPMPPYGCNVELQREGNPSCSLETYEGGYRCCQHGVFLRDTDIYPPGDSTVFYFKFSLEVTEMT